MYLFGEIVNILHNFDLTAAEFNAQRDKIKSLLQLRDVPPDMQLRVEDYLDEVWDFKHGKSLSVCESA